MSEIVREQYFGQRILAQLIDIILILIIHWIFGLLFSNYDQSSWYQIYLQSVVEIALIALFLVKYGQSPGKYFLGLRVSAVDGEALSWKMAIKRQSFFLLIPIVIGELFRFVNIADPFAPEPMEPTSLSSILLLIFTIALLIFFYFGSFLKWRGQTYWDRFAGTYVEKV